MATRFTYQAKKEIFTYILLVFSAIALAMVIGKYGTIAGFGLTAGVIGVIAILLSIFKLPVGCMILMVYSFYQPILGRLAKGAVPVGAGSEVLLGAALFGLLVTKALKGEFDWASFKNPITYVNIAFFLYLCIQALNPNLMNIQGWVFAMRFKIYTLVGYILFLEFFKEKKDVHLYLGTMLGCSILSALYGIYQYYFGLPAFERAWLYSNPERVNLLVIFGNIRIWSFQTGPTQYGMLMSYVAIISFILCLNPKINPVLKVILAIGGVLMVLGMTYSGTRTATAMIPLGFALFFLMNMDNKRVILFSCFLAVIFLGLYFGPFYSAPINRLRSTFKGDDDPSMNVRTRNRTNIQPYIYKNPLGGGPSTTEDIGVKYSPSHPLAGFPPDSGYLRTALELGWIGLVIELALLFIALVYAVTSYYRISDPELRNYYGAFIAAFFALCIANFTQFAMSLRPMDYLVFSVLALFVRLKDLE